MIYWTTRSAAKDAKESTIQLLYKTDHEALLKACREVLKEGKWEKKRYNFPVVPDPNTPSFPKAILKLNPSYIVIYDEGFLSIEMMGGMSQFGILAYPEGFVPPSKSFYYGDKKLIEGLWYYDDGYREDPNYEQYLESLRSKKK